MLLEALLACWLLLSSCMYASSSPHSPLSPRSRRGARIGAGYLDKIADPPATIDRILTREEYFLASPSITKLQDGRLMVVYERFGAGAAANKRRDKVYPDKLVSISSNRGKHWKPAGTLGPMLWPTVFSTPSGVYAMGVERGYSVDNNMVISRMLRLGDGGEAEWTKPRRITEGLSLVTANGGLDISKGVVTKAVELVPAKGAEAQKPRAVLLEPISVDFSQAIQQLQETGVKPRLATIAVRINSTAGFVEAEMVAIQHPGAEPPLLLRVAGINAAKGLLVLEPELINLALNRGGAVLLPAGSEVTLAGRANAHLYGATDWQEMVLQASAAADLTDPSVWLRSNPVGNPAGIEKRGMSRLLGGQLTGAYVEQGALGEEARTHALAMVDSGNITKEAYDVLVTDLGSPFFMEGTPVRLQDRRGGDQSLLVLMRVNNDKNCNMGALLSVDDQGGAGVKQLVNGSNSSQAALGPTSVRFLRYTFAPGISISHAAILYDEVSDAYWYVNNVPRDSRRNWNTRKGGLQSAPGNPCMVDRSSLGLFYSGNAEDWVFAGMIDFTHRFLFHFTYPDMLIEGADLLVVSRATMDDFAPDLYRNHNSNAIVMHRVRNFRRFANLEWLTYMSEEDTQLHARRRRRRPS